MSGSDLAGSASPSVAEILAKLGTDPMNAGPNSTTFTLAPILFPTQLRATASGFAAGVAKIGATLGVFVLPISKGTFGVPAVLGMMAAVSILGLVVTVAFGHADRED
jgi:putative MFS transporter